VFEISRDAAGTIHLQGRLDAASVGRARDFFTRVESSAPVDFSALDYIASVGLGVLVAAQRRLRDRGAGLRLTGLSPHLREVLVLAGFEGIFDME